MLLCSCFLVLPGQWFVLGVMRHDLGMTFVMGARFTKEALARCRCPRGGGSCTFVGFIGISVSPACEFVSAYADKPDESTIYPRLSPQMSH